MLNSLQKKQTLVFFFFLILIAKQVLRRDVIFLEWSKFGHPSGVQNPASTANGLFNQNSEFFITAVFSYQWPSSFSYGNFTALRTMGVLTNVHLGSLGRLGQTTHRGVYVWRLGAWGQFSVSSVIFFWLWPLKVKFGFLIHSSSVAGEIAMPVDRLVC